MTDTKVPDPLVPAEVDLLDLDAIKRAGLNSAEVSERLLQEHAQRTRLDLDLALMRPTNEQGL